MENFNEKQKEAISSKSNVTVVIAGAGSGKTTVLVQRIKKLMDNGVLPSNILAITFTNKAAKEMKDRLIAKVGPQAFMTNIMTFHRLAIKIIKENIDHVKSYNSNFIIIDEEDKKKIIKQILKDKNLLENFKVPEITFNISGAKSKSLTYKNVETYIDWDKKEIYKEYVKYCKENNCMDFDDLLLMAYELLKVQSIKERYNELFKFINVDEYQDTSLIQGEMLRKIKGKSNNLFIVGDVDQSIYGWRGAIIENILNIHEEYDDVSIIKLEQNYRSTKNILDKANILIQNNDKRIEKNLWTENDDGVDIEYYNVSTNIDEANIIVREVNAIVDYGKGGYDNFAVLYRYNYQSRKIEEQLIKNKIPYKIFGGLKFYERMEIKDILAYLRLFNNNEDNVSFNRIANVPKRKVGEKTLDKILAYSRDNNMSMFFASKDIGGVKLQELISIIEKYSFLIKEKNIEVFSSSFDDFLEELGYKEHLLTIDDEDKVTDRMRNLEELKEGLIQEIELGNEIIEYVNEMSLVKDFEEEEKEELVLSTIHGVKGLEFDNVFIIGMVQGRFPKIDITKDELEEERRLAYVAITRAKKRLWLLSHVYDYKYEEQNPSIFLDEMNMSQKEDSLEDFIF